MVLRNNRHTPDSILIFKELYIFLKQQSPSDAQIAEEYTSIEIEFRKGIENAMWKSDKEACLALYGKKQSKRYNKLKTRVRRKILNQIVAQSNPPSSYSSKIDVIYQKINQDFFVYNILKDRNYTTSAAYLGELLISNCIQYGRSEFTLKVTAELIEHFSISDIKPSKVKYYLSVHKEFLETVIWEQKASIAYAEMMNLFVVELEPGEKAIHIADKFLPEAEEQVGKLNSVRFHLRFYLIKVFKHYCLKDYQEMDQVSQQSIFYLKRLKVRQNSIENMFLKKRVEANLILGNINLCREILEEILTNSPKGTVNWLNTLELSITINIHEKRYNQAIVSFSVGRKNSNFETTPITTQNRWGLLEAYINFLQLAGATPELPTMSRYRINKFINDTPQYSEDKKGRNIQLIIAQLLFYIIDKNWGKMEEKIEALQRYGTRYLRKGELFRSQVFIKMLLEIPKRMYHPEAILRHTAKYQKRLVEMKPDINLNGSTLEIIPYEHLWELIIHNIVPPKNARKSTKNKKG